MKNRFMNRLWWQERNSNEETKQFDLDNSKYVLL